MKRSYYIVPIILLAAFGVIYWQHSGEMERREIAQKQEAARVQAEEDAKKKLAEQKAREDAEKRLAAREAEERAKQDEKEAKKRADLEKIKSETERYNQTFAQASKEAAALEKQLADLRAEKEKLGRESFDLAKKVERAFIDRRTAEFQVQRMAEMVAKRASNSAMTKLPTPPAPPASR